MFNAHEDLRHENENKQKRLNELLIGMPDEKTQKDALYQYIKYKENRENRKNHKSKTSSINGNLSDEDDIMVDEDFAKVISENKAKKRSDESMLPGYETMMMMNDSGGVLPGYETMMIDEQKSPAEMIKPAPQKFPKDARKEANLNQPTKDDAKINFQSASSSGASASSDPKASNHQSRPSEQQIRLSGNQLPGSEPLKTSKTSQPSLLAKNDQEKNIFPKSSILSNTDHRQSRERLESDLAYMADNSDIELSDLDTAIKSFSNQNQNSNLRYIIIDGSNVARE